MSPLRRIIHYQSQGLTDPPGNLKYQSNLDTPRPGVVALVSAIRRRESLHELDSAQTLSECSGYCRGEPGAQAWEKESARRRHR